MTKVIAVGVMVVSSLGKDEQPSRHIERQAKHAIDVCTQLYLKRYTPILFAEGEVALAIRRLIDTPEPDWFLSPPARAGWPYRMLRWSVQDRRPSAKELFEEAAAFFKEHEGKDDDGKVVQMRFIALVEPRGYRPYLSWLALTHKFTVMSDRVWRYAIRPPNSIR